MDERCGEGGGEGGNGDQPKGENQSRRLNGFKYRARTVEQ